MHRTLYVIHSGNSAGRRTRHVLVIHNPTAGRRRPHLLAATLEALRRLGCTLDLRDTTCAGDAEAIVQGLSERPDVVAVAGGDGTIGEVVNGLVALTEPTPPLAVIPLGTANLLACEIGLTGHPEQAARVIAEGRARTAHLGTANGRHFVMMTGIGLDAQVVANVGRDLKKRAGKLAYVAETANQLCRYPFPTLRAIVDGREYEAGTVVACNGRHYGGRFAAAPAADLGRPELQVVLLDHKGWSRAARHGLALVTGRLPLLPDVTIIPARRVRVIGPAGAPVQGDGDIIATLPVDIAVADRAITVLAPE